MFNVEYKMFCRFDLRDHILRAVLKVCIWILSKKILYLFYKSDLSSTSGAVFIKTFTNLYYFFVIRISFMYVAEILKSEYLIKTSFIYSIKNYQINQLLLSFVSNSNVINLFSRGFTRCRFIKLN